MADSSGAKEIRSSVDAVHIEKADRQGGPTAEPQAHGTVQLLQGGSVVLIPTPSPDPKGNIQLLVWLYKFESVHECLVPVQD